MKSSALTRRRSRGLSYHDRSRSHARCGNAVYQSEIPATAAHNHNVGNRTQLRSPGLPTFCRVTATLTPTSNSTINIEVWLPETTWNGRFAGIGGGGFQGPITNSEYSELATGIKMGFATAISDLGTGSSGCTSLFCGSAIHRQRVFSDIRSGSRISATGRST